ncbi:MAG: four helix bundle protein [Anaerolineaceae bacterium]|nr:four helix bundle protein [Anaerolineaceae bacterium]
MPKNNANIGNSQSKRSQYSQPDPDQHSYKNLIVWQKGIDFAIDVIDLVDHMETDRKHYRLIEQLEASATSVPMNIAEGKGRFTDKDYGHYLVIARGSLYETMTLLEIFMRKNWISIDQFNAIEKQSIEISKMLTSIHYNLRNQDCPRA